MRNQDAPKLVIFNFPIDEAADVKLSPHRFRRVPSHLVIVEGRHARLDVHLTDAQLRDLYHQIERYLG